jgi:hypothetical protein
MRLEKREIMLNEQDSLLDVLFSEKALLSAYVDTLPSVYKKETRERLLCFIKEVAEEFFLIKDVLEKIRRND